MCWDMLSWSIITDKYSFKKKPNLSRGRDGKPRIPAWDGRVALRKHFTRMVFEMVQAARLFLYLLDQRCSPRTREPENL